MRPFPEALLLQISRQQLLRVKTICWKRSAANFKKIGHMPQLTVAYDLFFLPSMLQTAEDHGRQRNGMDSSSSRRTFKKCDPRKARKKMDGVLTQKSVLSGTRCCICPISGNGLRFLVIYKTSAPGKGVIRTRDSLCRAPRAEAFLQE